MKGVNLLRFIHLKVIFDNFEATPYCKYVRCQVAIGILTRKLNESTLIQKKRTQKIKATIVQRQLEPALGL